MLMIFYRLSGHIVRNMALIESPLLSKFPSPSGWELKNNRITLNFRKWDNGKWRYDRVPYTFFKHRQWHGKIRRLTVKRDACGNYWLYIITDYTNMKRLPTTGLLKLAIAYSFTIGGRADNYSGRCFDY